jgi:hypothetical protein
MSTWTVQISSTFKYLSVFRSDLINLFQNQLKNTFELSDIMKRMFDDGANDKLVFCLRLEHFNENEIDTKEKNDTLLNNFNKILLGYNRLV